MSNTRQTVDRTGNGYCGPLVLAAIMGCDTSTAAERVRRATNQPGHSIKGTSWWELELTLRGNGFRTSNKLPLAKRYVENRLPGSPSGVPFYSTTMEKARRPFRPDPHNIWMPCMDTYIKGVSGKQDWSAPFTPLKLVGPTLAEWLRSKRNPDAYYIVEVNHHWVLVKGRKFVDTFTKGEWVFIRSAPHRRKRVKNVWEITPL